MRRKLLVLIVLLFVFGVKPAFAAISFTISNPQKNGNEVIIDVSISGLTTSSCLDGSCYLQAAFTSSSPIRYFGSTKNNSGQWYEYISSPGSDYIKSTFFAFKPTDGLWSGQLVVKINPESPNYKGSGEYNLKAWRYSGKSDSYSGDSDKTLSVNIEGPAVPTPSPTPTPTPSPTPTPTKTLTPTATPKKTAVPTNTPSTTPARIATQSVAGGPTSIPSKIETNYRIASVAGATIVASASATASSSATIEVKDQRRTNPLIWIGLVFVFAGVGTLGYIYIKKNAKLHLWFRH